MNEATLKQIVYEAAKTLIENNLRGQMSFGTKGPLPVKATKELFNEINPSIINQMRAAKVDKTKKIPRGLIDTPEYFGGSTIMTMYKQYSEAKLRRADLGRKPVNFFTFAGRMLDGFLGGPMSYYESNGNYLIGIMKTDVFICVYFAPKNSGMGMFKFIKEVCEYNNVVFSVTDDMASMLERLGCPKYGEPVMAKYEGKPIEKYIYGTTQETAEKGAKLVGLMGKGKDIMGGLESVISQSPELKSLYEKDPNIVSKLIADPTVLKFMMENPDIVDKFIADPTVAQRMAADPVSSLLNFLQKKAPKTAGKLMNEMRRRKHGFKL